MHDDQSEKKSQHSGERYLSFSLGEEEYAIPLLSVKEVIAMPEVTSVPQTPPHFLGIINLRGQVISLIDLRLKLSIKPRPDAETAIIICDLHPNCIGVVVDSINHVLNPKVEELSDKPEIPNAKNTDYICGVFRNGDQLVLLLDIQKTLSAADQQAVSRASSPASAKKAA